MVLAINSAAFQRDVNPKQQLASIRQMCLCRGIIQCALTEHAGSGDEQLDLALDPPSANVEWICQECGVHVLCR